MEKPVPPRLEDFGLSQAEYGEIPRLIHHRLSEKTYTRLGLLFGAIIGLAAFLGFLKKIDSVLQGWFFGVPIGFVVFLMGAFISAIFVKYSIRAISVIQRLFFFSASARRAFLYDDAMKEYDRAMIVYQSQFR